MSPVVEVVGALGSLALHSRAELERFGMELAHGDHGAADCAQRCCAVRRDVALLVLELAKVAPK